MIHKVDIVVEQSIYFTMLQRKHHFSLYSFLMLTSTWPSTVQYCTLTIFKCFIPRVKFHFKFFRSVLSTEWIFKRLLIKTEKDCGCPRSAKTLYLSLLPLSRGFCPYPFNTANLFWPISDHINRVPLYHSDQWNYHYHHHRHFSLSSLSSPQ